MRDAIAMACIFYPLIGVCVMIIYFNETEEDNMVKLLAIGVLWLPLVFYKGAPRAVKRLVRDARTLRAEWRERKSPDPLPPPRDMGMWR